MKKLIIFLLTFFLSATSVFAQGVGGAYLTYPVTGDTMGTDLVTFTWNKYSGAYGYVLDLGTSQGAENIFSGGVLGYEQNEQLAGYIPMNGSTLYVRLYTTMNAGWSVYYYRDYTFDTETISIKEGELITPDSVTVPILWTTQDLYYDGHQNPLNHDMFVKVCTVNDPSVCSAVDPGATTGFLGETPHSGLLTATGLPANSSTLYVHVGTKNQGAWNYNTYTFTAATSDSEIAAIFNPADTSTLTASSQLFQWNFPTNATYTALDAGSTVGGNDYYDGFAISPSVATTDTATGLPVDASTIYVRLYTALAGQWLYNDYTYTASGGGGGDRRVILTNINDPNDVIEMTGEQFARLMGR
jgi:hypothetical protein